jgi:succinate dehydrogenase/fumarate reductase cytochrome b subunit
MMQFLPLIGAWLDKSKLGNKLSQKIGKRQAIMLFTLMFTALAFALFIQAFYGIPLIKE